MKKIIRKTKYIYSVDWKRSIYKGAQEVQIQVVQEPTAGEDLLVFESSTPLTLEWSATL